MGERDNENVAWVPNCEPRAKYRVIDRFTGLTVGLCSDLRGFTAITKAMHGIDPDVSIRIIVPNEAPVSRVQYVLTKYNESLETDVILYFTDCNTVYS